jgi:hypothetical protein
LPPKPTATKVVYIAGPYRADTIAGVVANIRAAEAVAAKYLKLGYAVICPHKNTGLMDGICTDNIFLAGYIEIMLRCDAVILMDGFSKSEGARREYKVAKKKGMPTIYDSAIRAREDMPSRLARNS